jgi:hypothetical protein
MPYTLTPTSLSGPLPNLVGDFEGVMAANYDAKTADVLRFWFFTARENGWNLTRLAKTTGVSYTTLYRLFRGEYSADAGNAAEKLIRARETFEPARCGTSRSCGGRWASESPSASANMRGAIRTARPW